jgi:hypothetical protein
MKNFFISYTQSDRDWAEWIAWQLEGAGYSTVIQAWDFRPGQNFVSAMHRAAQEAERTIPVLSPSYLESKFGEAEWIVAFAQDPTGEKGLLVPVRIKKCDLEGLLGQVVYIDLVERDETVAREVLLNGVISKRAKPALASPFPGASKSEAPLFPGTPAAIRPGTSDSSNNAHSEQQQKNRRRDSHSENASIKSHYSAVVNWIFGGLLFVFIVGTSFVYLYKSQSNGSATPADCSVKAENSVASCRDVIGDSFKIEVNN